jgi:ATP-binding cassette subfamily D (ALD) long-chain fatty acid import protein
LAELRERLAKVEEWKRRRQEIDDELNKVWVEGGDELAPPPYESEGSAHDEGGKKAAVEDSYEDEESESEGMASPTSAH